MGSRYVGWRPIEPGGGRNSLPCISAGGIPCSADDDNGQQSARRELHGYLLAQAAACSVAALTALLLIPPRPPHHASRASQLADLDIAGADGHQAAASWKFFAARFEAARLDFSAFPERHDRGGYRGLNNSDRERNLIQSTAACE